MKPTKQTMVRICAEEVPDVADYLWVNGFLAVVYSTDNKWAFADHIKDEGGGTQGEHHAIIKNEPDEDGDDCWNYMVGEWLSSDLGEEEAIPSDLEGLLEFSEFQKFANALTKLRDRHLTHHSDIEWPDEEREGYWVKKSVMETAVKDKIASQDESGMFWLSLDTETDSPTWIDVESLSEEIPGNMKFIN